jgi:hypothetical protein
MIMENLEKLNEHATAIRTHGKRILADVVSIGEHLTAAKRLVGHRSWEAWLYNEFAWSARTAQRFMGIAVLVAKNDKMSDLDLPLSALYLLAAPSTPPKVIEAIVERSLQGEPISLAAGRTTRAT